MALAVALLLGVALPAQALQEADDAGDLPEEICATVVTPRFGDIDYVPSARDWSVGTLRLTMPGCPDGTRVGVMVREIGGGDLLDEVLTAEVGDEVVEYDLRPYDLHVQALTELEVTLRALRLPDDGDDGDDGPDDGGDGPDDGEGPDGTDDGDDTEVLGDGEERDDGDDGDDAGDGGTDDDDVEVGSGTQTPGRPGTGGLATTGAAVSALVLIGLLLTAAGLALLRSRRTLRA